jgi:hypothetical protein
MKLFALLTPIILLLAPVAAAGLPLLAREQMQCRECISEGENYTLSRTHSLPLTASHTTANSISWKGDKLTIKFEIGEGTKGQPVWTVDNNSDETVLLDIAPRTGARLQRLVPGKRHCSFEAQEVNSTSDISAVKATAGRLVD